MSPTLIGRFVDVLKSFNFDAVTVTPFAVSPPVFVTDTRATYSSVALLRVIDSRALTRWAPVSGADGIPMAIGVPDKAVTGMSPHMVGEGKLLLTEMFAADTQRLVDLFQYRIVERTESN